MSARLIDFEERFVGGGVVLRLVTLADCTDRYLGWLTDLEINRYLETRWLQQTHGSICTFVTSMMSSNDTYLFAIIDQSSDLHIGNIKIGPVHARHAYADVSYFIGDRSSWGKGFATDAVRIINRIGFERLLVHRLQAGLYGSNIGSARVLEKAGYVREGCLRKQLRCDPAWEDHVFYGLLHEEWNG